MPVQIGFSHGLEIRFRHLTGTADHRHTRDPQGITLGLGHGHEQAGARVARQVLRVHGHAADQEKGAARGIKSVGHEGAEREALLFPGVCGQHSYSAETQQGA